MRGFDLLGRRKFLVLGGSAGAAVILGTRYKLGGFQKLLPSAESDEEFLRLFGPMDRTLGETSERKFYGDQNARPHAALWDLKGYFETHKAEGPIEEAEVVIIGGGASGLFTAYELRDYKPVVLEQAQRFGGNAKGQSWRGVDFAIGSAYIDTPHAGQPMERYFKELKLDEVLVQRSKSDPVHYDGKIYKDFWAGESDPAEKDLYLSFASALERIANEADRPFPFIPSLNQDHLQSVKYFDEWSLHEFAKNVCGGRVPLQLDTALEHYCWSTYAGSSREISAAGALNFLAQEINPIWTGAGGNAKIVERLMSVLFRSIPKENFRSKSLVVDVKVGHQDVLVSYEDAEGKLRQVRAKVAVMACPKFVAARLLNDLETERVDAIRKLRYRSYMTANLLINKKMDRGPYDIFMLGDGKAEFSDVCKAQEIMNATDFVMANFAQIDANYNVLTFYRAFPCDGMRAQLNQPSAYETYRKNFEQQIDRDILPMLNLSSKDIVDLRLTLWGHALPLAEKGIYRDGLPDTLRKSFKDRVFFVEQDNWAYPSLQTGATDIALMKEDILKFLG